MCLVTNNDLFCWRRHLRPAESGRLGLARPTAPLVPYTADGLSRGTVPAARAGLRRGFSPYRSLHWPGPPGVQHGGEGCVSEMFIEGTTDTPCFMVFQCIALHRGCSFYKGKASSSSSAHVTARFIVMLALSRWPGTHLGHLRGTPVSAASIESLLLVRLAWINS